MAKTYDEIFFFLKWVKWRVATYGDPYSEFVPCI